MPLVIDTEYNSAELSRRCKRLMDSLSLCDDFELLKIWKEESDFSIFNDTWLDYINDEIAIRRNIIIEMENQNA